MPKSKIVFLSHCCWALVIGLGNVNQCMSQENVTDAPAVTPDPAPAPAPVTADKPSERPDPNRWQREMQEFAEQDRQILHRDVVFTGSSSIRFWKLEESFGDEFSYINRGFGGSILHDSLAHFPRLILPYSPKVVVLYAGDNDLNMELSPDQVVEDYQAFCQRLRQELPEVKLIYIAIKPSLARWNLYPKIIETNQRIQTLCEQQDWQSFADIAPATLTADGQPDPDLFVQDGLHINADGYQRWTQVIKPLIEQRLAR